MKSRVPVSVKSWRRQARLGLPGRDKEQRLDNAGSEVSTERGLPVVGTPRTCSALKLSTLGRCYLCQREMVADPKRQ